MVAEEDGIVDPVVDRVADNAPLLTMDLVLAVLLDADDADVAVARARSDACHLICTLYAFKPSFTFVKLVVVVFVPAPSVTTIVIGPSETIVPIAAEQP